ncbi:MAG: HAMP domain-containing histidine kinase [Bacteroidetes bacterium]|nr:HAMP domain-containing histidine kinase [Bacteroidota bacterium]
MQVSEFYKDNAKLKWVVLIASVIISIGSIYYTNILVEQLKERERAQVRLFARAIEYTLSESDDALLFVSEEIIAKNNSIPTIWRNAEGQLNYRNIDLPEDLSPTRLNRILESKILEMEKDYDPIPVNYRNSNGELENYGAVYYEHSFLLTQLLAYPYIQLTAIAVFGIISFLAFNYSKEAEQNRVWVGLAKETAHQLGTPISSLMAWTEVLRDDPELQRKGIPEELDKDIRKLKVVTERFSSIGSAPALKPEPVVQTVNNVVNYLRPRLSAKIRFIMDVPDDEIMANIHTPLFEWVLENLFKNAVDSMGSSGTITVRISRGVADKVLLEVSDTGKGIPAAILKKVFRPGFTTKKRGWGLGLALARRIIENYHEGRIFVRSTGDQGTTFRIEVKAA